VRCVVRGDRFAFPVLSVKMAVSGEVVSELLDLSLGIVRACVETACNTTIPLEIRQLIVGASECNLGG
jgi:hypothetical protein